MSSAARVTPMFTPASSRLLHHAHVLTCGPKSWRTRLPGDRAASWGKEHDGETRIGSSVEAGK